MTESLFIITTAFKLCKAIESFLSEADDPEYFKMCEAVVALVAESADMIAVTRDDLPKERGAT